MVRWAELRRSSRCGGRPSVGGWREWSKTGGRSLCLADCLFFPAALPKAGHKTITHHSSGGNRWQKQRIKHRTPPLKTTTTTTTNLKILHVHMERTEEPNNRHIMTEPLLSINVFIIQATHTSNDLPHLLTHSNAPYMFESPSHHKSPHPLHSPCHLFTPLPPSPSLLCTCVI